MHHIEKAQSQQAAPHEADHPQDPLQAGTARGSAPQQSPDPVDVERERIQMEEAGGFYQLRKERREAMSDYPSNS